MAMKFLESIILIISTTLKEDNLRGALTHARFELVRGDIGDAPLMTDVFERFKPDRLVHLAAWAGVRPSIETPGIYSEVNLSGTINLFEHCRQFGVERIVFASSSSVYGDRTEIPFRETDDVSQPISPYAATKRCGELLAYTWHHLFGFHIHCLRFFTVYGPRQRPEMAIAKFVRMIDRDETITVFGDGESARDYTYIDDIIEGVVRSIERVDGYRIYNLGNSTPTRLSTLVRESGHALDKTPKTTHLPMQPGDVSLTYADVSRATEELGYRPSTSIPDGLAKYVDWYRTQLQ